MQESESKQKYSAPAVRKALEIIELMAKNNRSYTVTEISSELDISVNSAFRIYKELDMKGYVVKDDHDNTYDLTPKLYYLGSSVRDRVSLVNTARPYMNNIRKFTGETVLLTIFGEGRGTIVVDQLESSDPIKFISTIGRTYDSYCSAMGKAMLSALSKEEFNDYLKYTKIEKKTDNTITDKKMLGKEIEEIRRTGVAFDVEENLKGLSCIASPIFSGNGKIEGAIGISGLSFRMNKDNINSFSNYIKEQAQQFSALLGYKKESTNGL